MVGCAGVGFLADEVAVGVVAVCPVTHVGVHHAGFAPQFVVGHTAGAQQTATAFGVGGFPGGRVVVFRRLRRQRLRLGWVKGPGNGGSGAFYAPGVEG